MGCLCLEEHCIPENSRKMIIFLSTIVKKLFLYEQFINKNQYHITFNLRQRQKLIYFTVHKNTNKYVYTTALISPTISTQMFRLFRYKRSSISGITIIHHCFKSQPLIFKKMLSSALRKIDKISVFLH